MHDKQLDNFAPSAMAVRVHRFHVAAVRNDGPAEKRPGNSPEATNQHVKYNAKRGQRVLKTKSCGDTA